MNTLTRFVMEAAAAMVLCAALLWSPQVHAQACQNERLARCTTNDPLLWSGTAAFKCVKPSGTSTRCADAIPVIEAWSDVAVSDFATSAAEDGSHTPTVGDSQPSISWIDLSSGPNPCAACPVGTTSCTCLSYSCPSGVISDADIFIHESSALDDGAPPVRNDGAYPNSLPHRAIINHEMVHVAALRDAPASTNAVIRAAVPGGHRGGWTAGYTTDRVRPGPLEAYCLSDWYPNAATTKDLTLANMRLASSTTTSWSLGTQFTGGGTPKDICPGRDDLDVDFNIQLSSDSLFFTSTKIKYYVSEDEYLDGSDVLLGYTTYTTLTPATTPQVFTTVSLPTYTLTLGGVYVILAEIDADGTTSEWNETNNVLAFSTDVAIHRDYTKCPLCSGLCPDGDSACEAAQASCP